MPENSKAFFLEGAEIPCLTYENNNREKSKQGIPNYPQMRNIPEIPLLLHHIPADIQLVNDVAGTAKFINYK